MKFKKVTASLLMAACTFACACGDGASSAGPVTGGIITEPDYNVYVEGMLHDVNVDFDAPVADFVVNGETDYKVVCFKNNATKAGSFIVEHIRKASGANMETITEISEIETIDENTKFIFVGCEDIYEEMGGEMPTRDEIGPSGYKIETIGKNVFINTNGDIYGYQMGVLAFLREVIGYDMLAEDCVIYENDARVMPEMNILERPDFDYRQPNGSTVTSLEAFGMGYSYIDPMINTGTSWMHNIYDYVSKEEAIDNPEWLSNDSTQWQMCYNARGNKEKYTGLIHHLADKIKGFLMQYPTKSSIIIGQHDIGGSTPQVQNCKCTACQASYNYYGTMGGAWLSLCNRVSIVVDEWLKTEDAISFFGEEKEWNLLQLVYHTQVNPPIERDQNGYVFKNGKGQPKVEMWFNEDGSMEDWADAWTSAEGECLEEDSIQEWSDTHDEIYTAPNVHYMYATSAADWIHSYYESQNASWKAICDGWTGVGGKNAGTGGGEFYVWAYALNSRYALYPYNSFDSSWETTRYFKSLGAKYMFWQSHYQNKENSGFTALRNYMDAKVEFDVNADYYYYLNKFFTNFYGIASDTMMDFFEQIQAQCAWIEEVNQVTGNIHNIKYGNKENWPEGLIDGWMDLIQDAYDLIETEYRVSNPRLYELYTKNVMIEEQFPLIVQCTTYADSYEDDALKAKRQRFLNIFNGFGNKVHAEGGPMTEITDLWDME